MELHQLSRSSSHIYHCPFDKAHVMPYKTVAAHLIKCPRRPPNYTSCFFNCMHVLPDAEIKEHEKICPNRHSIDDVLYDNEDDVRPNINLTVEPKVEDDELWDEPLEKINVIKSIGQSSHFMKVQHGLTKSERKKYRAGLRTKSQNVDMCYNKNLTMHERGNASTSTPTNLGNQKQTLFFGKRPDA